MGKVRLTLHNPGGRDLTTYDEPKNIKIMEHNLLEFVFGGKKHTTSLPFEITEELSSEPTK